MKKRIILLSISLVLIILFCMSVFIKIDLNKSVNKDINDIKKFKYVDKITVKDFINDFDKNINLEVSDNFYYYRLNKNIVLFIKVIDFTGDINNDIVLDSGITSYSKDEDLYKYISLLIKSNGIEDFNLKDVLTNTYLKAEKNMSYELEDGIYIHYHSKYDEYIITRSYK